MKIVKPNKIQLFKEITKHRLSMSVVFSSIAGYLIAVGTQVDFLVLLMLAIGGYCMVGASNAYNQIIEVELDKMMDRTKTRPIPSGNMTVKTAMVIAVTLTVLGLVLLYLINPKSAMFGGISIFMYVSLYTPLKTKTPLSVFVGAFPGAIPFMLGWVAATNNFGIEAGTLFLMQFLWQFPHFWAIGWFLHDDYAKAHIYMLPTGKQDKATAAQIVIYTLWTIVASIIPVFGFTGALQLSIASAVIVVLLGLGMLYYAILLYKKMDNKTARQLMLASVSYITLVQIVYVIDKFLQ